MENKIKLVPGFSWFGKNVGIKDDSLDFGGILSDVVCQAAGVFTKSSMPGAPVVVGKEHIKDGRLQAVIVNSKNANTATELRGIEDTKRICNLVADACGIEADLVLPSSTGVIGIYLPMDKIVKACSTVNAEFGKTERHIIDFAHSIMTTDTRPKWISANVGNATITGIAKGAAMIEPNMATMLCYFMTDAKIDSNVLRGMLKKVTDKSFDRISVDTDTSTSDTVVIMANGLAGPVDLDILEKTLLNMSIHLAKEIMRDGEGSTKLIELVVSGANSQEQALKTAKTVINSPLVKTAIHGADPNWGRFVMAIGKVFDHKVDIKDLKIFFGEGKERLLVNAEKIDNGEAPLSEISDILKKDEIHIEIVLGRGVFSERVWGCDLTEDYVRMNAYYTT